MCVCLEASGTVVCEADGGAQFPLPQVSVVLQQPVAALPVPAAGMQRCLLARRQRGQVCLCLDVSSSLLWKSNVHSVLLIRQSIKSLKESMVMPSSQNIGIVLRLLT